MLSTAQLQAIKASIDADPVLATIPNDPNGAMYIASELNKEASPTFVVWRSAVTTAEVGDTVSYIAVEAMTDINRGRINTFYSMNPSSFNPSRADIRSYWSNTFSGTLGGAGQATRDALDALWRRNATNVEKIFASGTGTTVSPAILGFEGMVSHVDIQNARNV
jgi:hypothetical protein